jgi:hypothetical protein
MAQYEGLYTKSYADDPALLITGKFLSIFAELMQRALNTIQSWCRAKELSVGPNAE